MSESVGEDSLLRELQLVLRRGRLAGGRDEGDEHTTKSLAKRMAQEAAASIEDRKSRAAARTAYYNQLVNVLRLVSRAQAADRAMWWRMALASVAGAAAASALATWWLMSL